MAGMGILTGDWMFVSYIGDFVMLFILADLFALLYLFYRGDCDPRVMVTWAILLTFIPPAGFVLYCYMGLTWYRERREVERHLDAVPGCDVPVGFPTIMANAGAGPYSDNNEVRLYTEGEPLIDDVMADLARAERHILVEYYIIRDDHDGNAFVDLLTSKVEEGLEVRLMVDAFGIGKGPKKAIKRFVKAGGHYAQFHSTWKLLLSPRRNHRNHRKFIIIDGRKAYCGGFNIGDEYRGLGPLGHWRDGSVSVEGPGLVPMVHRFHMDWDYCASKKDPLTCPSEDHIDPTVYDVGGNVPMQIVSAGPDTMPDNPVEMQYHAMMVNARRRLYITTPYLGMEEGMMISLSNLARSGVDVRILMPDKKDHIFLFWNNLSYADLVLGSGVRIWRYNDGFIHEKVVIMDDDVLSVGSANMDCRSMTLNFETNMVMYSEKLNEQAAEVFLRDLDVSTELTHEDCVPKDRETHARMAVSWHMRRLA